MSNTCWYWYRFVQKKILWINYIDEHLALFQKKNIDCSNSFLDIIFDLEL